MSNKFLNAYIDFYISAFRRFDLSHIDIEFTYLNSSDDKENVDFQECIKHLHLQNIDVAIKKSNTIEQCLPVIFRTDGDNQSNHIYYSIGSLPALFKLSQQTGLSTLCLITMRIVANVICRKKIIYKAIVLDLDETLLNGTLSEDGKDGIVKKMKSISGYPFIAFMKFIKLIEEELGIYIAICTRNDSSIVKLFLDEIDERIFPIKNQIDLVVSNNNDKSENIKSIAAHLSILPNAIVFIDDNQIIRDEVRCKIPEVYVPDWDNHSELITQLIASCIFERNELSISSKNRKRHFKLIQEERKNNTLPELYIKVNEDKEHVETKKLYAKSNQFKLSNLNNNFSEETSSLYFELYRKNYDSLGICSTITYNSIENECVILNWAISCRYFEIGLEEFVLLYMLKSHKQQNIFIIYQENSINQKVKEMVDKYFGVIKHDDCSSISNNSDDFLNYLPDNMFKKLLSEIRNYIGNFDLYSLRKDDELLVNKTNLKTYKNG